MRLIIPLLFLLSGFLSQSASANLDVGLVKNKKGELLLIEKHSSVIEGDRIVSIQSEYFDLKGKKFAELNSKFDPYPYAPVYRSTDFRFDRYEDLSVKDGKIIVEGKSNGDSKVKSKVIAPSDKLASGQGLHNFVRSNFQKLIGSKDALSIDFLIPMNQKSYGFRIRHFPKKDTDTSAYFRVEFDSWFFRLVAPNLDVEYRKSDKRLLKFIGPYHLLDKDQNSQSVTIDYAFDDQAKEILKTHSIP